jgi:hypothetical protein
MYVVLVGPTTTQQKPPDQLTSKQSLRKISNRI